MEIDPNVSPLTVGAGGGGGGGGYHEEEEDDCHGYDTKQDYSRNDVGSLGKKKMQSTTQESLSPSTHDQYHDTLGANQSYFNKTSSTLNLNGGSDKPRYLQTTKSWNVLSSGHDEHVRILNSYRTGSFNSIKKLPVNFRPGAVESKKILNVANNRTSSSVKVYKPSVVTKYFTPITYSRTEYNKLAELERNEQQYHRVTTQSFSRKPFSFSSSQVRLKHEDQFGSIDYSFPILGGPSTGKVEIDKYTRTDLTNRDKFLYGPFRVIGKKSDGEGEVARNKVEEWCKELFTKLSEDWPHLRFTIKFTEQEELQILFDTSTLTGGKANIALSKYMNNLAKNGVAADARLRKRGDRWKCLMHSSENFSFASTTIDENKEYPSEATGKVYLLFTFLPPWCNSGHVAVHRAVAKEERVKSARRRHRDQPDNFLLPKLADTPSSGNEEHSNHMSRLSHISHASSMSDATNY